MHFFLIFVEIMRGRKETLRFFYDAFARFFCIREKCGVEEGEDSM